MIVPPPIAGVCSVGQLGVGKYSEITFFVKQIKLKLYIIEELKANDIIYIYIFISAMKPLWNI